MGFGLLLLSLRPDSHSLLPGIPTIDPNSKKRKQSFSVNKQSVKNGVFTFVQNLWRHDFDTVRSVKHQSALAKPRLSMYSSILSFLWFSCINGCQKGTSKSEKNELF